MAKYTIHPLARLGTIPAKTVTALTAELSTMTIENDARRIVQDNIRRLRAIVRTGVGPPSSASSMSEPPLASVDEPSRSRLPGLQLIAIAVYAPPVLAELSRLTEAAIVIAVLSLSPQNSVFISTCQTILHRRSDQPSPETPATHRIAALS